LNFLDKYSKKNSNVKFHENLSDVSRDVLYGQRDVQNTRADGRKDRNDEADGRVSQFFESAKSGSVIKKFCARHVGFIVPMWLIELYQLTDVINEDVM